MIKHSKKRHFIIGTVLFAVLINIIILGKIGNDLSSINYDSFAEAGAVRSALGFYHKGYLKDFGLTDQNYGGLYPDKGWLRDFPDKKEFIYTHYPPLAEWLDGLMTYAFGPGQVQLYRLLPISLCLIAMGFLMAQVYDYLQNEKRMMIFVALFFIFPINTLLMHHLHAHSYPLAGLWGMLAIAMNYYNHRSQETTTSISWKHTFGIGFLAFLEGWLTFDYFFIIAATPFLVSLLYPSNTQRKQTLLFSLASLGGFGGAHFLHIIQVALYYGSIAEALHDLLSSGMGRMGGNNTLYTDCNNICADILNLGPVSSRAAIVMVYMFFNPYAPVYWLLPFGFIWVGYTLFMSRGTIIPDKGLRLSLGQYQPMALRICIISLLVSIAWMTVMAQHGMVHVHLLSRHFFITWFIMTMFTLKYASKEAYTKPRTRRRAIKMKA